MRTLLHALVIEDLEDDAILIARELRGDYDLTFERVDTPHAMQAALERQTWDIVISDYAMPRFSGLAALELSKASGLDLPFIIVSGAIGEEVAVAAMKAGAHDYVMKDNLARLVPAVQRELDEAKVRRARRQAEAQNRALLDAIPDLIFQFDAQGVYLNAIPAKDMDPIAPLAELVGKNVRDVLPPEIAQQYVLHIKRALQSGDTQVYEYQLAPEQHSEARIIACGADQVMVIVRDVTQRVQVEEAKSRLLRRTGRQHAVLVRLTTDPALAEGRLDEALPAIAKAAAETLDVGRVSIWELSSEGGELCCLEAFDRSRGEHAAGRVIPVTRYPRYFAALETGRVLQVADVKGDPRTDELTANYWEPLGIGAAIEALVRLRGQVVGVVCHEHVGPPRHWLPDEVTFAGQVADLVALALLNADLRRSLEAEARRRREAETLHAVTQVLSASLHQQQVFDLILTELQKVVPYDVASVQRLVEGDRLEIIGGYGFSDLEDLLGATFDLAGGDNPNREVMRRRVPLIVDDAPALYRDFRRFSHARTGAWSWLGVPLLFQDRPIGMIALDKRESGFYTQEHARLALAFAAQAAIVIENARLFQEEQQRRREAEALRELSLALGSALEVDLVLEQLLEQVKGVIPYDGANVALIEDGVTCTAHQQGMAKVPSPAVEQVPALRHMLTTRSPYVVPDTRTAPDWTYQETGHEVRSWVGAPIVMRDNVIGFFSLDSEMANRYTPEHAELLAAFATHAALAIETARMFDLEEQQITALSRSLEKQQELDQLKDEFIQNVSHELRTPLGLIRGYAEMLNEGYLGEIPSDHQEPIAVIARRARLLNDMVDNLTAILEAETQEPKREPVDLSKLVRESLTDFQVSLEQAELTLTAQIAPDLPLVSGDPNHLRRVLDNLLQNARKFTPAAGGITVRLEQEGADLALEVSDTGIGIPGDQVGRVFERFYQVDGTMSRRYGGTGLGLALVKQIAEAHGGDATVQSILGEGSTFRITLPCM